MIDGPLDLKQHLHLNGFCSAAGGFEQARSRAVTSQGYHFKKVRLVARNKLLLDGILNSTCCLLIACRPAESAVICVPGPGRILQDQGEKLRAGVQGVHLH